MNRWALSRIVKPFLTTNSSRELFKAAKTGEFAEVSALLRQNFSNEPLLMGIADLFTSVSDVNNFSLRHFKAWKSEGDYTIYLMSTKLKPKMDVLYSFVKNNIPKKGKSVKSFEKLVYHYKDTIYIKAKRKEDIPLLLEKNNLLMLTELQGLMKKVDTKPLKKNRTLLLFYKGLSSILNDFIPKQSHIHPFGANVSGSQSIIPSRLPLKLENVTNEEADKAKRIALRISVAIGVLLTLIIVPAFLFYGGSEDAIESPICSCFSIIFFLLVGLFFALLYWMPHK